MCELDGKLGPNQPIRMRAVSGIFLRDFRNAPNKLYAADDLPQPAVLSKPFPPNPSFPHVLSGNPDGFGTGSLLKTFGGDAFKMNLIADSGTRELQELYPSRRRLCPTPTSKSFRLDLLEAPLGCEPFGGIYSERDVPCSSRVVNRR